MKQCSQAQYAKFYPTDKASKAKINKIKDENGFFCHDWGEEGWDLFGYWRNGVKYQALEFGVYPCASTFTRPDGS